MMVNFVEPIMGWSHYVFIDCNCKAAESGLDNMRLNHLYCEASALRPDGRKQRDARGHETVFPCFIAFSMNPNFIPS